MNRKLFDFICGLCWIALFALTVILVVLELTKAQAAAKPGLRISKSYPVKLPKGWEPLYYRDWSKEDKRNDKGRDSGPSSFCSGDVLFEGEPTCAEIQWCHNNNKEWKPSLQDWAKCEPRQHELPAGDKVEYIQACSEEKRAYPCWAEE